MTLRIALTGGIGSGKSTVTQLFAAYHINIIDADKIALELTSTDPEVFMIIKQHFGDKILNHQKQFDRAILRKIIFSDPNEKKWLEELLHPKIRLIMQQKSQSSSSPYCLLIIPLLAEATKPIDFIDRICVVDCPKDLQIERTSLRDHHTRAEAEKIIDQQSSREKRLALADDVIENDGSLEKLSLQVEKLDRFYRHLSAQKSNT